MIVSIKETGGHQGSAETRLAKAAQCAVEDRGAGAVRGAANIGGVGSPLGQTSCCFPDLSRSAAHEPKRTFHQIPRPGP